MKQITFFIFLLMTGTLSLPASKKPLYEDNKTQSYEQLISAYRHLAREYPEASLLEAGETDIGKPLHLFILSGDKIFDPVKIGQSGRPVVFINNGIHPGEPAGIEASLQLAKDILTDKDHMGKYLDKVIICIIPVYNVGGMLNRSHYHRANQDTPPESGFRGNGKHLDLNRDFVKADSKNTRSLEKIFRETNPLVFLDTHTTDGSDHQYTITLISTLCQNMEPAMGKYFHNTMVPALFETMKKTPYEMIPYVNLIHGSPDKGISAYNDLPRYSTGYASLFNTFAFMTENHVYKLFRDRVKSVYFFMKGLIGFTHEHASEMMTLKKNADLSVAHQEKFVLSWELDTTVRKMIPFRGYSLSKRTGEVTGLPYRWYDHTRPFVKKIPFYENFNPVKTVEKPDYYIIPQAWEEAVERLRINGIRMVRLERDTLIQVTSMYITSVKYTQRPYNGHFQHRNIRYREEKQMVKFYRGDYIIPTDQPGNRYIIQVLEPDAPDSYFSWNFFDPVLDRREYFSPSTFEEKALDVLEKNPDLKKRFEEKKKSDPAFARNRYQQLGFIYNHSPWLEKSYMRVPVFKVTKEK